MPIKKRYGLIVIVVAVLGRVCPLPAGTGPGVRAVTQPSGDVTLSFVQPGRIAEVGVKEGNVVGDGQILICQDDTADEVAAAVKERMRQVRTSHDEIQVQRAAVEAARGHLETLEESEEIRERLTPEFLLVKLQAQDSLPTLPQFPG